MVLFQAILVMLAAAVLLLELSRRTRLPYPVLLALAGTAVALAPIGLKPSIDPALVLALFVAPVLLDAAFDTPVRDLKANWAAVMSLALFAVGITTVAVAALVHTLVPAIPWAAAIAIGAIVAPPDAVSANAVLRHVGLPHRVKVILEGEALLNDAATLLIYRLAVAAVAAGGTIRAEVIAPAFLLSVAGSVVAGPALAWLISRLTRRIDDAPSSIIFQFVMTFGVWVFADRIGLSPILTIVTFAMTLARSGAAYQSAALRVPSYAVWDTVVLVLNVLAFLLIGLELGPVIAGAPRADLGRWVGIGLAVLATVIAVRLAWTLAAALVRRGQQRRAGTKDASSPSWQSGVVVGWAGTRGIVTVATALALPLDFPERGMLLVIAMVVTLGTLLIQGLTLRPLVLALGLGTDDLVDGEVRRARADTAEAALAALDGRDDDGIEALRDELEIERRIATEADEGDGRPTFAIKAIRAEALRARRDRLIAMRAEGTIGDDAFHQLEEELDLADLATATRT